MKDNLAFDLISPLHQDAQSLVYLCGFRSDFMAIKATALAQWCQATGRGLLRFDYSGHGQSGGDFLHGTIGKWVEEAAMMLHTHTKGRQILVGSSMGGWIALQLAKRYPERVAGIVGIAAAPDFTENLLLPRLGETGQQELWDTGMTYLPNCDPDFPPWPITRALIEDGRVQRVLTTPLEIGSPIHLLHGLNDADVPWQTALTLANTLTSQNVRVTLVKGGDHRLSRTEDIALLKLTIQELLTSRANEE